VHQWHKKATILGSNSPMTYLLDHENPKSEYRDPKQIQMFKNNSKRKLVCFEVLSFAIVSDFAFRASNLRINR